MAATKVATVKSAYTNARKVLDELPEAMFAASGQTPVSLAKTQIISAYKGQMIDVGLVEPIEMNDLNFDRIISTEADRLAERAKEILAPFVNRAADLLAQLDAIWTEASALLEDEDERMQLPDLPNFEAKTGRRGGGNGGGARVARDWTSEEYVSKGKKGGGWKLAVESRDAEGDPESFSLSRPNGELLDSGIESAAAAARIVARETGLQGNLNALAFFQVPAL